MIKNKHISGPLTIVRDLNERLLRRWTPKWHDAFSDPETGLFYERLGHAFKPVPVEQRRLLTQCRQLSLYSDAAQKTPCAFLKPHLTRHFDALMRYFSVPETGGFHFSIDTALRPLDTKYDLYAHGFVIFACAHYARATNDPQAGDVSARAAQFIDRYFRMPGGGFAEAIDADLKPVALLRRHESHMHLLEACLFAAVTFPQPIFRALADELVDLFFAKFYNAPNNELSEYFTDDLVPAARDGHLVLEPGHYCEWIWLLKKHARLRGDSTLYDDTCLRLLSFAFDRGWDAVHGGIYDEIAPDGRILNDTKRLWPFAEALKAHALMLDAAPDRIALKKRIGEMVFLFRATYMQERGFWTEWVSRDLAPATDYMPGTTPYHVYFGITEALEALEARGRSKSLLSGFRFFLYQNEMRLSRMIKTARKKIAAAF